MDEPTPQTNLLFIGIFLLLLASLLYWTPLLDLTHRSKNPSSRDSLLTGSQTSSYCLNATGELENLCHQLRLTNYASYGLYVIGAVLLIWGLAKKKTHYTKKDALLTPLMTLVCLFLFFTFYTYRLDKITEKTPLETYDTHVIEHTTTYEKETEITEEIPVTREEVSYYDNQGNKLKDLEVTQYEQGVGSPCRPWAQVKNTNPIDIAFDVNFTYTVYDIIAQSQTVTVPDQTIKAQAITKVVYFHDEEGKDAICKLSHPTFAFHEDNAVKKKVKTTMHWVNQTRKVEQNKSPDVYNETKKIARTQYIENVRLVGKWWWE